MRLDLPYHLRIPVVNGVAEIAMSGYGDVGLRHASVRATITSASVDEWVILRTTLDDNPESAALQSAILHVADGVSDPFVIDTRATNKSLAGLRLLWPTNPQGAALEVTIYELGTNAVDGPLHTVIVDGGE